MEARLLSGLDLVNYAKLCDEDCLSFVRDEAGGFRDGCFGIGILNKEGRGRAILLAASENGQSCRIVRFVYNEEVYPEDGLELIQMAQEYMRVYGITKLECEYVTQDETGYLPGTGWSEPRREAVAYCFSGEKITDLCTDARKFAGKIIPYQKITTAQWQDFRQEKDQAGESLSGGYADVMPKLCFGAIVDERLAGYMRCSVEGKNVVVNAYDALESQDLLPVFFAALYRMCRYNLPKEWQFYANNEQTERRVEQMLTDQSYRKVVWQMSELTL